MFPPSSPNQGMTGAEFVGLISKADDYRTTGSADPSAVAAKSEGHSVAQAEVEPAAIQEDAGWLATFSADRLTLVDPVYASATADPPASAPASGPVDTNFTAVTERVVNKVQWRPNDAAPWRLLKEGDVLGHEASVVSGPAARAFIRMPEGQTLIVYQLTEVTLLRIGRQGGIVKTDIGMKHGRAEYEIIGAGVQYESNTDREKSPRAALAPPPRACEDVRFSHRSVRMRVTERAAGDVDELELRAGAERDAARRDRYRAVPMAIDGREAVEIAEALGRSRRGVQDWVYAYRDGGVDALRPRPRPGRPTQPPRDREPELKARLDAGPRPAGRRPHAPRPGRRADPGRGVRRDVHARRRVRPARAARVLVPDPAAAARAVGPGRGRGVRGPRPPFVDAVRGAVAPAGGRVRVWLMDEARFGRQGTVTDVRAGRGSRPRAVRQTRYEWVYPYAAVEPATGASAAPVAPNVNTGTTNAFLRILDAERKAGEHFVPVMDGAGRHKGKGPKLPGGVTVLLLPPYSPELDPVENLWHYPRSHYLGNRSYDDYDALPNAGTEAYRKLTPDVIKSVCRCRYFERAD
jgi:transposase